MRSLLLSLLCGAVLTACGTSTEDSTNQTIGNLIKAKRAAKKAAKEAPKAAPPALTRAAIAHITKPLMRINAQSLGQTAVYAQVAKNGVYTTYLNTSKMSVTFNNGIITATRGFGLDLLSQGLSIPTHTLFAERNAPITYTRTQQQLANVKTVAELDYECTLTKGDAQTITVLELDHSVLEYTELCTNADRRFKNTYWVDVKSKFIWKSEQSIGKQAGFFVTEILIR